MDIISVELSSKTVQPKQSITIKVKVTPLPFLYPRAKLFPSGKLYPYGKSRTLSYLYEPESSYLTGDKDA